MKISKGYTKRINCASCNSTYLETIYNFGIVPLAGYFPSEEEKNIPSQYPLEFQICNSCSLVQTDSTISPDILFKDYRYISSVGMQPHFNTYANWLIENQNINPNTKILEFGCNDGPLIKALNSKGIKVLGVDPAKNIVLKAQKEGLNIINDFFNIEFVKNNQLENQFDYILSSNSFAHIENIQSVIEGVKLALNTQGKFIIEVQYLVDLIDKFQFDFIYHEHLFYYTLTSLKNLFKPHNLSILDFEFIPIHSGSIRVIIGKGESNPKVLKQIEKEKNYLNLNKFGEKIENALSNLDFKIKELKSQGKKIAGYGASGRANMIVNTLNLTPNKIDYIVDESPERADRYMANTLIPVVAPNQLKTNPPDYILIFAWNFSSMIIEKTKDLGIPYIIPFPEVKICNI